jgi:hypothetical protein
MKCPLFIGVLLWHQRSGWLRISGNLKFAESGKFAHQEFAVVGSGGEEESLVNM